MNLYIDYEIIDKKIVIKIKDRICDTPDELLNSELFKVIVKKCVKELCTRNSYLVKIFGKDNVEDEDIEILTQALEILSKMPSYTIPNIIKGSGVFFKDIGLFHEFVEYLYNYWRNYFRIIVCASARERLDSNPYRTFNLTIEQLTNVVRKTYRDVTENLTGLHPRSYRQVIAGAEIATIATPKEIPYPEKYKALNDISVIRQVLLYPPLIFDPPMNKRTGGFVKIDKNPMDYSCELNSQDWLCYPAKVGPLLIHVYLHKNFYELGLSMCNLFEIAEDEDLRRKPDGIYFYGASFDVEKQFGTPSVFHHDKENDIFVGAIPNKSEFGYFGYLKKMILTLYNSKMMSIGRLPYHGALVKVILKNNKQATILIIGDSGAGKSETLTAFNNISKEFIQDMFIIADDMGSLDINEQGEIIGYGTEIGAFLRLDDLNPGYAFGQIDRAIIMSPNRVNARILLPVTTFENIVKGFKVDFILYANNYDDFTDESKIIEKFSSAEEALEVFREGKVASKGTTTSKGIVQSYFANIFGPPEYRELHDELADKFFAQAFKNNMFVGQMRTRLGVPGYEQTGPEEASKVLLDIILNK